MVACAIVGCSRRTGRDKDVSMFSIPKVGLHTLCQKTREVNLRRRAQWISRINRADLQEKDIKAHTSVCSLHFVYGKPASWYQETHPDWAPSLHLGHDKIKHAESAAKRFERTALREEVRRLSANRPIPVGDIQHPPEPHDFPPENDGPLGDTSKHVSCQTADNPTMSVSCQTELTMNDIHNIETECLNRQSETYSLRESLGNVTLTQESLSLNDDKVKFYTGLPSYAHFMVIFNILQVHITQTHRNILPKITEFFIFLMRLRLNSPMQDLAFRFNISQSTVSRIFDKWLDVAFIRLSFLTKWPTREELQKTMPSSFREAFGSHVAVIIDCFEVFTEKPSSLLPRSQTWSQYKHHNTVKFLIGITPQGTINFISKAWGGRASDKYITENSGFLDKLSGGDIVMADRGFDIADSVGFACARLLIPAFTRGKSQLSSLDVETTRKLASLRIHVERVIGLVRRKYTILQSILPTDCLVPRENQSHAPIDKIAHVCCSLTNVSPSVVMTVPTDLE